MKLNIDGAFSQINKATACGGLVLDAMGKLIKGFSMILDDGDALLAEIWAMIIGLRVAWDTGCRNLIVESDSKDLVDLIQRDISAAHRDANLIEQVKCLLANEWVVEICHISRNKNKAADIMAKLGLGALQGLYTIDHVVPELEKQIILDSNGNYPIEM